MTQDVFLPSGVICFESDGSFRAHLRSDPTRPQDLRGWFDKLGALNLRWMLLPTHTRQEGGKAEMRYSGEAKRTVPLETKVEEWLTDLRTSLPMILKLVKFATLAADQLNDL